MNKLQQEIDHVCKWSNVLNVDAYGILLDKLISKRTSDGLSTTEIDNIVLEIINEQN